MRSLIINDNVALLLISSESKALSTYGKNGLNVVPVSTIKVVEGKIWLINYFMEKTVENIISNESVSLVCWSKMFGYQIKGIAKYVSTGEEFMKAKIWVGDILPERVVKGLIIITPREVYDIAPTKNSDSYRPE